MVSFNSGMVFSNVLSSWSHLWTYSTHLSLHAGCFDSKWHFNFDGFMLSCLSTLLHITHGVLSFISSMYVNPYFTYLGIYLWCVILPTNNVNLAFHSNVGITKHYCLLATEGSDCTYCTSELLSESFRVMQRQTAAVTFLGSKVKSTIMVFGHKNYLMNTCTISAVSLKYLYHMWLAS